MKLATKIGAGALLTAALVGLTATAAQATESDYYTSSAACKSAQQTKLNQGYVITKSCHDHMDLFIVWSGQIPNYWTFDYSWVGMGVVAGDQAE
jgi:hypothetical protein